MSTKIFYFSGTGNSLVVAKRVKEAFEDSEIISISDILKNSDSEISTEITAENIGFVFPLYCFSLPEIVIRFLKKYRFNAKYIFAVVTRAGGAWQGGALSHADKLLKAGGTRLSAGYYIRMPSNYLPMTANVPEEAMKQKLKNADEQIYSVIKKLVERQCTRDGEYTNFIPYAVHPSFIKYVTSTDKGFHTDNNCNGCGICEKVCKVSNITMKDSKPQWQHKCQSCMACINYCPCKAIQYKKRTQALNRYHHPEVPVNKYINS